MKRNFVKVALVHDYIKEYGGAERVLETLHEIWPKAPIYTTVYLPNYLGPHKERVKKWDIRPSILQGVPFKAKLISPMRIIAPYIFKSMDFSKYDVVIVSATGAYSPNSIKKSGAVHICYCHTPPRYLYGYATAREWKNNPVFRVLGEIANHFLRMTDFESAQNVDYFIANSNEVGSRIEKFYRRDSTVIYPPIDTRKVPIQIHPTGGREYYLAGGRLARPKRVDLAVVACTKLNLPLKVFGKEFAGYGDELRKMAGPTVEFLGEITEEEKWELFAGAKAYISPSLDEDFGMLNVEVMAAGTPVIALRSGGAKETIVDGKTGLFFDKPTVESLTKILKQFNGSNRWTITPENCVSQAKKFSKERFKKEIKAFILNHAKR